MKNILTKKSRLGNVYLFILLIRYPFMLSEVFASENSQMIDYFFEPDKNVQEWEAHEEKRVTFLPRLFEFLDADYLNVTSAGYFAKVVGAIIRRRGFDVKYYNDKIL